MSQVGFGSYRVSIRSNEHRQALILAIQEGCALIDTSANYTNGESEELIGSVLKEYPHLKPFIVTKAGYIQGNNILVVNELNQKNQACEDLVEISQTLKHSIHPEFLENQLDQSLKRLQRDSVDYFLLHNPEYYFQSENPNQDEYYARLKKAFIYCEEEVKKGRIKYYGISSNNFILPLNHPEVTDLNKILNILENIGATSFKMVQFPFNLIEIGALEKGNDYGEESLLELCMKNNLLSVVNRPLNAFTKDGLIRLATYEDQYKDLNDQNAQVIFENAINILKKKWDESSDENITSEDFYEIGMIKQFTELWKSLKTPDAVEQVYFTHFFPFIARVWGKGLTPEESQPFYDLMEASQLYSRRNLSNRANEFKKQAQQIGLLPDSDARPFATMVIETYLDYGFDYVLVGMKKPEYVDQLKHLF